MAIFAQPHKKRVTNFNFYYPFSSHIVISLLPKGKCTIGCQFRYIFGETTDSQTLMRIKWIALYNLQFIYKRSLLKYNNISKKRQKYKSRILDLITQMFLSLLASGQLCIFVVWKNMGCRARLFLIKQPPDRYLQRFRHCFYLVIRYESFALFNPGYGGLIYVF